MTFELENLLPPGRVTRDPAIIAGYLTDRENAPWGNPVALVRPVSTGEVAKVVEYAYEYRVPVVPRGAGTGLTGGCNAVPGGIVLSLERMKTIKEINTHERYAVVEPGVVNEELRAAARRYNLWYPPDPGSKDMSSLGGNVATNAGGFCCMQYGVTKDYVLAMEVVTGAGDVLRLGRRTAKNSVGLDLAALFVGSEGCLGVITEITLRLRRLPPSAVTVVGAFGSLVEAVTATMALRTEGVDPRICELMDDRVLAALEDLEPLGLPDGVGGLLLLQFGDESAAATAEVIMKSNAAFWTARGESPAESELLFAARRRAYDAVLRRGRVTTGDVCVPVGALGAVMTAIQDVGKRLGVKIATIAHAGDGNLHPMLIDDGTLEPGVSARAVEDIMDIALRAGGTVSGEHGVGLLKRVAATRDLGDLVVNLSSQVKSVFDPRGIMNPGKGALMTSEDVAS